MGFFKKLVAGAIKTTLGYKELEFNVAGVSFKNGRKSRQSILRAMKFQDPPFDKGCCITFERYSFDNQLAISVLANGQQIGNVPKEFVNEFNTNWVSDYIVQSCKITGGGSGLSYGCSIKVIFNN